LKEGYVGDKYCDIISRDVYLPEHTHSDCKKEYEELMQITTVDKIAALGETGPVPSLAELSGTRVPWTWFMTWSKDVCYKRTSEEELRLAYNSGYGVTLDKLPRLY
jgi:mannan endo-1,4-beta-mannosidase